MAAEDHTLALRGAVIAHLKGNGALTALVPADRIRVAQPEEDIDWPWVRWGSPITRGDESSGLAGSEVDLTLHAFGVDSTQAHRLARLLQKALDEAQPAMEPEDEDDGEPFTLELVWTDTQVVPDSGRVGGYHAIVQFTATTAEER